MINTTQNDAASHAIFILVDKRNLEGNEEKRAKSKGDIPAVEDLVNVRYLLRWPEK